MQDSLPGAVQKSIGFQASPNSKPRADEGLQLCDSAASPKFLSRWPGSDDEKK